MTLQTLPITVTVGATSGKRTLGESMFKRCSVCVVVSCLFFIVAHAAGAPGSASAPPQSAQLESLLAALDRNDASALGAFWKGVDEHHSPLIEELPGQPDDALYTFLWRADLAADAVNIRLGAVFPTRTPNDAFQRLGTSNLWYTSYVLPKAARLIYRIRAPQGMQPSPLAHDRFTLDGVRYELFRDPLNPSVYPAGSQQADAQSIVEGPAVVRNPFVEKRKDAHAGSLQDFDIDSRILGGHRTVTMYTPAGYSPTSRPTAFLLVFDAEPYIELVSTPTILDNMISKSAIPHVIAAFVHSRDTRDADLPANMEFQKFVATELMPWVRQRYRISTDPKRNVAVGSSFGGLAAAYTAFNHPELFGKVVSQSGSYWWSPDYPKDGAPNPNANWMVKRFAESAVKPIRFYMDVGIWEPAGMLNGNRMMLSVLKGKGNQVTYNEFVGGHYYAYWRQTLPAGLIAVLGDEIDQP